MAASVKSKSIEFCQEIQQEFYKWISATGLTADNCPKRLKHYLLTINEVLENKAQEFIKQMKKQAKEIEEKQNLNDPKERKAINTIFGGIQKELEHPDERKEVDIKGVAKLGKEALAEIAKSVSTSEHQNFNFLTKEKEKDNQKKETANDSYKDLEKTISTKHTKGGARDAKIFLGIVIGITIIIIASVYFLKSKSKKSQ